MTAIHHENEYTLRPATPRRDYALDGFKLLAFALMALDHYALFAGWHELTRLPGRMVLPMFAVMLAYKSHMYSSGKMIRRLFAWGCFSQLLLMPLGWLNLNALFTLGLGLWVSEQRGRAQAFAISGLLSLAALEVLIGMQLVQFGAAGVFMVAALTWNRDAIMIPAAFVCAYFMNRGDALDGVVSCVGLGLSLLFIIRHEAFKWVQRIPTAFWYAMYPLHVLLIWVVIRLTS